MSQLNSVYDKIYLINLKRRTDRFHLMNYTLTQLGIIYQHFQAVDETNLKNGAKGLISTYRLLLEDAILHQYSNILILEDDISFIKDFDSKLDPKLLITDLVYLGANQIHFSQKQQEQLKSGYYELSDGKMEETLGAYAIGMNQKTYQLLYQRLTNNTDEAIDKCIYQLAIENQLHTKIMFPFLVMPDVTQSDIRNPREQADFCLPRKYQLQDYHYLSVTDLAQFRNYLNQHRISLAQILSKWNRDTEIDHQLLLSHFKGILGNTYVPTAHSITRRSWMAEPSTSTCPSANFVRTMGQGPSAESATGPGNKVYQILSKILNFVLAYQNQVYLSDLMELIAENQHYFVFIIPIYQSIDTYSICLQSCLKQNYDHCLFRLIVIDDATSKDESVSKIKEIADQYPHQIQFFQQSARVYQGANRYYAWNLCLADEIAVMLDGDDWLQNLDVLATLNQTYQQNILMTYGSFYRYVDNQLPKHVDPKYAVLEGTRSFPPKVIQQSAYRDYEWIACHLRTMKVKLLQQIRLIDLLDETGCFLKCCTDRAETIPCLEMAGTAHLNIKKPLMIYNQYNSMLYPESHYHGKANALRQATIKYLKNHQQKYSPMNSLVNNDYVITDTINLDCKQTMIAYKVTDPVLIKIGIQLLQQSQALVLLAEEVETKENHQQLSLRYPEYYFYLYRYLPEKLKKRFQIEKSNLISIAAGIYFRPILIECQNWNIENQLIIWRKIKQNI